MSLSDLFRTAAEVGGGLAVVLGIYGGIYNLFITDVSTLSANGLALMGVAMFVIAVISIDNRRKIDDTGGMG